MNKGELRKKFEQETGKRPAIEVNNISNEKTYTDWLEEFVINSLPDEEAPSVSENEHSEKVLCCGDISYTECKQYGNECIGCPADHENL